MSWFEAVPAKVPDDDAPRRGARGRAGRGAHRRGATCSDTTLAWHVAAPDPRLAGLLAELEHEGLEHLDDYDLVEFVAAAGRLSSWANRLAAASAAELAGRASMAPQVDTALALNLTAERVTGAELALRLGTSPGSARRLVRTGLAFRRDLAPTGEALAAGQIDAAKALVITDALYDVPTQLALGVQDAVLPRAPHRSTRQVAADIRAAIIQLDPAEAVTRHRDAADKRCVSRPKPLPDGMAGLWLHSTATEVHALYESIDSAARTARLAGDPRTLDQLRADLICQRVLRGECTAGATRPAGASDTAGQPGAVDSASTAGTPGTCLPGIRADVRVIVPLSTLIGTSDEPGELAGYGPIDPATARALAQGGTWRRLVTDPATGTVLDVGHIRYQPPADLAELVRHRDRTCVHPTCDTSAWSSELDHTTPFRPGSSDGGHTAAHNLGPLSKGCHLIKTHAGFRLEQPSPGEFWWTTPTGHRYTRQPAAPIPSLDPEHPIHAIREDLAALDPPDVPPVPRNKGPATSDDPGPPPF